MIRFPPLAMQADFYVLDNARETEKLIFVTLKIVGYFGLREIIHLFSLPQTATYKLSPSNGPIYLYTKNTSDYDHESPPDINPLHRYCRERIRFI